ncbi:CGNR zinc finger domain-containing protein [Mycolicibacterium septicum]|uniref:CGNR zinc finger domain-containing protein n=1 Tax=Mycolicibacterium septicum TaxID=98668 RepID=UPI0003F6208E|nr:CGNR zinc finger domain-containing protein [Mycolicibacterium septicum]
MHVNHYIEPLLRNVTDLVNRPASTPADLEQRWTARDMPIHCRVTRADVREVRDFLELWTGVVDAGTEQSRVMVLNQLLARFATSPSITNHDGSGWHLHYRDADAGFAATLAGATSAAAAHFLTERGMHRIRRCARDGCALAFVDFTRPGTQKYCSHGCANRDAVRRHRAGSARSTAVRR